MSRWMQVNCETQGLNKFLIKFRKCALFHQLRLHFQEKTAFSQEKRIQLLQLTFQGNEEI